MRWNRLQELQKILLLRGQMHEQIPNMLWHRGHMQVDGMCSYKTDVLFALCGEKTFQRKVPDLVKGGGCLVSMEINVENLFFWICQEVLSQLASISPTPLPRHQNHLNKPEQTIWMVFLKNVFDETVSPL